MTKKFAKIVTDIPGPKSKKLLAEAEQNIPKAGKRLTPLFIDNAKGATFTDVDGNVFIDFAGGIGVLNVGYCPDEVVKAIQEQAAKYIHSCFHIIPYESYVKLAGKLNEITPGKFPKKTLLFNGGAEAVENAIKIVKYYTKRHAILSFMGGFHGRTAQTLALTGKVSPYKNGFGPSVPGVYHLPYAYCYRCPFKQTYPSCDLYCAKYVENVFNMIIPADTVAGMIVESVQGEGGFIIPPKEFLPELYRMCKSKGIVYIDDEVQSGIARTGKFFATEHFGVEPDVITIAKSLGAGTVISAVTARADIYDSLHVAALASTYAGNPLSCQASLAVLDIIEKENILARANEIGSRMKKRLLAMQEKYPIIGDVRGLGAMIAIELVKDRKTKEPAKDETDLLRQKCLQKGLIVLSTGIYGNVLRFLMPLVISNDELDEGLSILEEVIGSIKI